MSRLELSKEEEKPLLEVLEVYSPPLRPAGSIAIPRRAMIRQIACLLVGILFAYFNK